MVILSLKVQTEFEKAKKYAFLLLKFRIRSKQELTLRLKKKGFKFIEINNVVDFLTDLGYIDDFKFAKTWISSRLNSKPCGKKLLVYELRQKGVAPQIINDLVSKIDTEQEYQRAEKAALQRLKKLQLTDSQVKLKIKLFAYLARRGFPRELITLVIGKLPL